MCRGTREEWCLYLNSCGGEQAPGVSVQTEDKGIGQAVEGGKEYVKQSEREERLLGIHRIVEPEEGGSER